MIIEQKEQLKQQDLRRKDLCDQDMHILSNSNTSNTECLKLSCYNSIGSKGMRQLARGNWQNLRILYLTSNFVGDKGCKYLSQANMSLLQQIYLSYNLISEYGIGHLSKANWNYLQSIDISNNQLNSNMIKPLRQFKSRNIEIIWIRNTGLQYGSIQHLLTIEYPKLQFLLLDDKSISGEQRNRINQLFNRKLEQIKQCFVMLFF